MEDPTLSLWGFLIEGKGWQLLVCLLAPVFVLLTPSGRWWTVLRALLVIFFASVFLSGAERIHAALAVGMFYPLAVLFVLTLALWAIRAWVWRTARRFKHSASSRNAEA